MSVDSRIFAAMIVAVASVMLAASTAVTKLTALGASLYWRMPFRLICHGMPERCLELWGVAMPICARCAAIYAGLLLGVGLFLSFNRTASHRFTLPLLALCVAPLALDGVSQAVGLRESVNALRILTGLLAGAGFAAWALTQIESNAQRNSQRLQLESVTADLP